MTCEEVDKLKAKWQLAVEKTSQHPLHNYVVRARDLQHNRWKAEERYRRALAREQEARTVLEANRIGHSEYNEICYAQNLAFAAYDTAACRYEKECVA